MRVLITGGAGFIGSHLAERVLAGGVEVVLLDALSTRLAANIAHLMGRSGFDFRVGSV
ncbi:MAG: GDP-mannose 4,6-dehydratase, partial [Chloroflexota bacterium]